MALPMLRAEEGEREGGCGRKSVLFNVGISCYYTQMGQVFGEREAKLRGQPKR